MSTKVFLSSIGRPVDPDDAKISVFDRGFLYGDSVYETMRTAGGRALELEPHLDRLDRSSRGIGLEPPFSHAEIDDAITATHDASGNDESYVRVIVTRGAGPIALDPRMSTDPTLVILVKPLELPPAELYERGLAVIMVCTLKTGGLLDPQLKTGNYLGSVLALREAAAKGGDDAILCNDLGEVAEGASSNVFVVSGSEIATPHLEAGLLAGITRETVCELASEAGHPPQERVVTVTECRQADELFLTSSIRGIMPVTKIDGAPVGTGKVGPVTAELRRRYDAYLREAGSAQ